MNPAENELEEDETQLPAHKDATEQGPMNSLFVAPDPAGAASTGLTAQELRESSYCRKAARFTPITRRRFATQRLLEPKRNIALDHCVCDYVSSWTQGLGKAQGLSGCF